MAEGFAVNNRKKLLEHIKEREAVVLFAGSAPKKRGDEKYPFSPDRNFYYLTGIDREKMVLLLAKTEGRERCTLYIPRGNGEQSRWVGANMDAGEAEELAGIADVAFLDEFSDAFAALLFQQRLERVYLDLERREAEEAKSEALLFAGWVRERYPQLCIADCYPIFERLRERKEAFELERIRNAVSITEAGILEMMRHARPGMMEYEIEAFFDFVLKSHGVRQTAFASIAASGKNGCILHYTENNCRTKEGDLILFDVGAQAGYYNGDLTRTFPVSGKFTKRQKQIYDIVLAGQRQVIEKIRPGVPFQSLNEHLRAYYFEELSKLGLAKTPEDVSHYYWHGVSHHLGAETHDVGRRGAQPLLPGMVITVEPGLYLEEEGIGIRIEDDVLVTEDGCEVLSGGLLKTVEEIEAFMEANRK